MSISPSSIRSVQKQLSPPDIRARKQKHEKIAAITAYDYLSALLVDEAGADLILVGDSLGCVVQGHTTTIPVTLDQMLYHARCVTRAETRAVVVGDMPFLTYQVSPELALQNAARFIQEGGCAAVKLEGGVHVAEAISKVSRAGIPVLGHVGLTPQYFHQLGGHKVQGRSKDHAREKVLEDALIVEESGAFGVVLECIPMDLAAEITEKLSIPTIGIGAGPKCDGQILVISDLLGLTQGHVPKFVKRFAELGEVIRSAVGSYVEEVKSGAYPTIEHSFLEEKYEPGREPEAA